MSERGTAIVIGGGLAGLAAACDLADAGVRVTVLEKRPFLGGRSYSYRDGRSGVEVDNGQHVFLGCCTAYIGFLKRLGVYQNVHLQKRLLVPVIDKVWGESTLSSSPALPPPLHLMPSLLRFKSISPAEKLMAAYAFAHIQATDRRAHPELDRIKFGEWLQRRRQSIRAIGSLWNLIVQPTLNDDIWRVSADLALMVFQEGFLRSRDGANVGWAKVGLSALLAEAAQRYIEERGGEVRLGAAVDAIEVEAGAVTRVLADGAELTADRYVVALPAKDLLGALPEPVAKKAPFVNAGAIESSPIVNVHLWYDRPVWDRSFAAFLNTPLQWAFNKSKLHGVEEPGQYIDISLSGARDIIDVPGEEIISSFRKEVDALFPAARGAKLERALVVKQRDATFAAKPGVAALRPKQRTPVAGLYLAGDWTDTGWPSTMESAVRSGALAAREVLAGAAMGGALGKEVIAAT
jgi:squalene-associated FAD-dependent desaturase